jgi:hypothetical protein
MSGAGTAAQLQDLWRFAGGRWNSLPGPPAAAPFRWLGGVFAGALWLDSLEAAALPWLRRSANASAWPVGWAGGDGRSWLLADLAGAPGQLEGSLWQLSVPRCTADFCTTGCPANRAAAAAASDWTVAREGCTADWALAWVARTRAPRAGQSQRAASGDQRPLAWRPAGGGQFVFLGELGAAVNASLSSPIDFHGGPVPQRRS